MPWEPEAGDGIAGRYELEEFLGKGGTAKAYSAIDRDTGDTVVLKHPNYTESQNDRTVSQSAIAFTPPPAAAIRASESASFSKCSSMTEADSLARIAAAGGHENVMDL